MTNEERWYKYYELAKIYYEENGHLLVPFRFKINNAKLGQWLSTQRLEYKNKKLDIEKVEKLEKIGMKWNIRNNLPWEKNYELAKIYYEKNGNLLIPQSYEVDGVKLGVWINYQRVCYKNNKLDIEKVKKLESIGMLWTIYDLSWEEYYELAKNYYEEHGNLLVPLSGSSKIVGIRLRLWITSQRKLYENNKLEKTKIQKLEAIGMIWNTDNLSWEENYELAKIYYKENGNLLIPIYYKKNGIKLGEWINNQRKLFKNNKLEKTKIQKLETIEMAWKETETKKIYKFLNVINNIDKNASLEMIDKSIDLFENYAIDNFINLTFENYDIDKNIIKNNLNKESYNIFILYLLGLDTKKISYLYDKKIFDIEKIRLYGMKLVLENIKEKNKIYYCQPKENERQNLRGNKTTVTS